MPPTNNNIDAREDMFNKPATANFLKNTNKISRKSLVIVLLIFSIIGGLLLWRSFALTNVVVGSVNVENLTPVASPPPPQTSNNTSKKLIPTDTQASGGYVEQISWGGSANGAASVTGKVTLDNAATSITIKAKGSKCGTRQPYIGISIDGNGIFPITPYTSGKHLVKADKSGWSDYTVNYSVAAGTHDIKVTGENLGNSSCSNPLFADIVTFYGPAPTTPPKPFIAFSGSASGVTPNSNITVNKGTQVTLTWKADNATACTPTDNWQGTPGIGTSGSYLIGSLTSSAKYGLTCAGQGGSQSATVNVTVIQPTPPPTTTPPPPTTPPPTPTLPFTMGVVAGSALSYEMPFIQQVGAKTARTAFSISSTPSSMASVMDQYAKAGIRPLLLALFNGGAPSTADAQNLGKWAEAYGPGGTFWKGKSYPANTAVTAIELGNETSYSYAFGDNSPGTYAARAQTYALRAKDAAIAISAANPKVGLLVQGDNAQQQTAWVQNMFKAVPNLGSYAMGWTIHPYGPNWKSRIDSTISSTKAAGSSDKPIWITEWGLSSDNGRCLSDNYGFNKCMTYNEAASTLNSTLNGMENTYGSRLGAFYLYQVHDQYATTTKTGREAYFGAIQVSKDSSGKYASKGAYTTEVKAELSANSN